MRYCHWKSNEHLADGLDGLTDMDVFVDPSSRDSAESVLSRSEYIRFTPQKGCRYPLVEEWIGFDRETGRLVHLHLHYQIITGTKYCKEYIFPINNLIIKTRQLDSNTRVYVSAPEIELVVLYCRIALKAKNPRNITPDSDSLKEIAFLKERVDREKLAEYSKEMLGALSGTLLDLFEKDRLSREDWRIVYSVARRWLSPYRKMSPLTVSCRHRYHYIRTRAISLLNKKCGMSIVARKTLPNRSLSICFLGQDGSGKSTCSAEICKWLNWKIEAHRFYLGSGDHYHGFLKTVLPKVGHKVNKSQQPSVSNQAPDKKKSWRRMMISKISRLLFSISFKDIARHAYKTLRRANRYVKNRGIAIYDRFPQNQFQGLYDGPKVRYNYLSTNHNRLLLFLAGREESYIDKSQRYCPDLVLKLVLPVEESMRRKPEENEEQVRRKALITEQLDFPGSAVWTIDATQDYQEEILAIKRIIWEELVKRQ